MVLTFVSLNTLFLSKYVFEVRILTVTAILKNLKLKVILDLKFCVHLKFKNSTFI